MTSTTLMPNVMTAPEAAEYLRVSERTLIRMRYSRRGPAWTYVGGQVRYFRADLDSYLESRRVAPVAEGPEDI